MPGSNNQLQLTDEPPSDVEAFRSEQPLISVELIQQNEVKLRKNKIEGAYASDEDYLDVQFRLLREDLVNSLRERIRFLQLGLKPSSKHKIRKIYRNLRFTRPQTHRNGVAYTFQMNISSRAFQNAKRAGSKNLKFGSLLALTTDGFQKVFIFGTIAASGGLRNNGGFDVNILPNSAEDFHHYVEIPSFSMKPVQVTAAESDAFCEAYEHVLKDFQQIKEVPFSNYIVKCETDVCPPRYLSADQNYQLFDQKNKPHPATPLSDQWLEASDLGLNPSQFDAFKLALTKEVAVIQGPPGTGKTLIGTKVVQVLLHNLNLINTPLLLVCYTNHALDQFLEHTLHHCSFEDVVRVGSQSKSAVIKKCTLFNKVTKKDGYWEQSCTLHKELGKLECNQNSMNKVMERFEKSKSTLMSHSRITTIPVRFKSEFHRMAMDIPDCQPELVIFHWLKCGKCEHYSNICVLHPVDQLFDHVYHYALNEKRVGR